MGPSSVVSPTRYILTIVTLYLLTVVSSRAVDPPAWWNDPIKEDAANYFFTASGISATGSDDALRIAQNNALEQIVARLGGSSSPAIHDYLLTNIRGWKVHAKEEKKDARNYHVWVIVQYPKQEFQDLNGYLSNGDNEYQEAVRLAGSKKWQESLGVLDSITREYPIGQQPVFKTEKAMLLAGQCNEELARYQEAKEVYERLLNVVTDSTVRREARTGLERARRKLPDQVAAKPVRLSKTAVTNLLPISQAVTTGASLDAALQAVSEERTDEAANLFDQLGNKGCAALLRDIAKLQRACRALSRGSSIEPAVRTDFDGGMDRLVASLIIWLPQTDMDKALSAAVLTAVRRWIDAVEADFPSVGGNKRDLIAVLNKCRELDRAMNLPPLEKRQPNAVQAYADYAEKYRTCPSWAVSKGIWIDAETGVSLEVDDKLFEIPFRYVTGGRSFFGDARKDKWVELTGFYVQERETSNKEFQRFCDETGWQIPEHLIRDTGFAQPDQPVTHVTHLDASRYAQWLSNKFRDPGSQAKWKCDLPSEAQWERSCRLGFPFDYPWGSDSKPTASLSQRKLGAPEQVGKLAEDVSLAGVMGLGGNVREWCRDGWTEKATDTITPGAKDPVLGVQWDKRKVVKGGCYFSERADEFTAFSRRAFEPENVEKSLGFRVVVYNKKGEQQQE